MSKNNKKIGGQGNEGHDIVLLESMRRLLDVRLAPFISKNIPGSPTQRLARDISNRQHWPPAANILRFLGSLFSDRFTDTDLPGFQGGMAYRESGKALHQSFYTWFVESSLSLTVNRLTQCFDVWLNQAYTARMLSDLENNMFLSSQSRIREANGSPVLANAHDTLHAIERILQAVYPSEAGSRQGRDFLPPSFQMIQPLLEAYGVIRQAEIRREFGEPHTSVPSPRPARLFVVPRRNAASKQSDWARSRHEFVGERKSGMATDFYRMASLEPAVLAFSARGMAEEIESAYAIQSRIGFGSASRPTSQAVGVDGGDRRFPITSFALHPPGVTSDVEKAISIEPRVDVGSASQAVDAGGGDHRFPAAEFAQRSPGVTLEPAGARVTPDRPMQSWESDREAISRWPVTLTRIERWFEQRQADILSFAPDGTGEGVAGRARPGNSPEASPERFPVTLLRASSDKLSHSVLAKINSASVQTSSSILLENNQTGKFVEMNMEAMMPILSRELNLQTKWTVGLDGESRPETPTGDLTFLRREEQMRPPAQSYAYAQPMRSAVEEERIVRHTREKEVVEVVRKEVETVMKSRSPLDNLSRSDYSRIADHVYSSLVRRLLMEKERSSLHF